MKLSNVATLMLLACAANSSFAAPAPVSDLNSLSSSSPESRMDRLERLLNSRNRVQLQMQQQIDDMTADIENMRGQLERNSHEMQQMVQRQRELFVEIDKLRSLQSTADHVSASTGETNEAGGTYSDNIDEQQAYQNAVDLILKKRDYAGAIAAFTQFQKDYPKSSYTPNAFYWLGQLYYAKKQDKEAISSFQSVLKYEGSNKRADALVKLGDIEKRSGRTAEADKYYQQVIAQYPGTASADLAKKHISSKK